MATVSLKKASLITAFSKYSTVLLGLFFSAFLARLLTPEDYGIVTVTFVFTSFFSLFSDMGIGSAIVQNKELTEDDINNIYSFTFYLSLILGILFCVFSFPLSKFYNNPEYVKIGPLLGVSLFFSSLNTVPGAILMREKKFLLVGIRTIVICIVTGVIGIVFAYFGFKYYALVFQSIIGAFVSFVWNYFSTKPKLYFKFKIASLKKIFSFSAYLFFFNVINYFSRNTDNIVISKFMGNAELGYYDKSYKLMLYPVGNLTDVITPVLHPILSDFQNDKKILFEKYIYVVKVLSIIGAFIMPFCFFSGEEMILILFGEQWKPAIQCFKFMSISIWAQMITGLTGSIFQSLNDTKRLLITGTINSLLTVLFILSGCFEGNIAAVSRNVGISYNIAFVFSHIMLIKGSFKYKLWDFVKQILPDIIGIFILFISGYLINGLLNICNVEINLLRCIIRFLIMGVIYLIYLILIKRIDILKGLLKK